MDIKNCINYLLTQTQNKTSLLFRYNLKRHNVTPAQYAVLYFLWEEDGLTPTQLAQMSTVDTSTITGLLTRLEGKGFIERKHSHEDRRGVNIYLTQKGAALQSEVCQTIETSNDQVMGQFSKAEQETLKNYLSRLCSAVDEIGISMEDAKQS